MEVAAAEIKGVRNEREKKFVPHDYLYDAVNVNFDSMTGVDRINGISESASFSSSNRVCGIFEFIYEKASATITENIAVVNGNVYKNIFDTPVIVYSGLSLTEKCDFTVLNDRLFITNGTNYPLLYDGTYVWEMGAPRAEILPTAGVLNGNYRYQMTIEIGGVESRFGTISNTVLPGNKQVQLEVPLGPTDVTSRKVYRTVAGGTEFFLLTTIADNTTLFYTDNTADVGLGAPIIDLNDPMAKPRKLQTNNSRLVGAMNDAQPNYLYTTETQKEFFTNLRGTINVTGVANDNTKVTGLNQDYDKIIVASLKQIYVVDLTAATPTVSQSRSNVGCLNENTMVRVPDNQYTDVNGNVASFPGGVMFLSTLNDVRVFNGNFALPVQTTLDNLKTENWSTFIRNKLATAINDELEINSAFYDYKYHLCLGNQMFVFDIRGNKWTEYNIETSVLNTVNFMAIVNQRLYLGMYDNSIIGKMYTGRDIYGESYESSLESADLMVSEDIKFFTELHLYFTNVTSNPIDINVVVESKVSSQIEVQLDMNGGYFDSRFFDPVYFDASEDDIDYRVIHINRYGRWLSFNMSSTDVLKFRGYRLVAKQISNKEM
tara:strand:- start:12604 stop:14409 length:1806 start_codon:yes stop_codon:yes gene_type:complete